LTSGVSTIANGNYYTCALTAGGGVKCWGRNDDGELGDGTITHRLTPVDVIGLTSGVSAIDAGNAHTCALTASGGVKCWGANYSGQIGDGTTTERHTPVNVSGLTSGVNAIANGQFHTFALIAVGGVKGWGFNYAGQLGDGTTTNRYTPVDVIGSGATPPFLDLPVQYTNFQEAAKGSNGGGGPGYVNSWFDHTHPGNGNADSNLTTWLGSYTGNKDITQGNCTTLGESCYNGHDGIDFRHVSDNVLAAAAGIAFWIDYQPNGFGNYLYIDHHNCYASFYAHLKNPPSYQNGNPIKNGDPIANRQQVGIMGNTGLSIGGGGGVHLHFGLYYDPTCDGNWSDKIVVDPYGWSGTGLDPWSGPSKYLWLYPYSFAQQQIGSSGGSASTPSGNLTVTVPANAVSSPITLELWDTPPVAGASATLHSTGNSFWMRVLEWLTGGSSPALMASASTNSFDVPVTVTVHYDPSWMPHLDTDQLIIYQWDNPSQVWVALATTLDAVNQQATAHTSQPGHFDLQAPLVCPADTLEPNDNYDGASVVQTDGTLVSNLFDIATDEDWFKFDAVAGIKYSIQTTNLAAGADTALEIYDTDGLTLLASNDNGGGGNASSLTWQAPQDGVYFARIVQASGSSFGCSSTYDFSVLDITPPGNVQASDGTYTDKVLVSWNASSGATSYKVYRAASAAGTKSLLGSPTGTSFNDTTATPGVTYRYWVKACNGANCSSYSAGNTGWRKLSAPTGLTASDGTYTTKVRVSWAASSGATSYKVYRATSAAGTKSLLGSPTGTSFNDTTATPGFTYRYWVKACKGTRCSSYSTRNTGWRKLSAPTNVQASDGTYTNKVRVSWNASSGATSYKIYRAASATGTKSLLGSPTGTSFNDTTAKPGVTYYYWVKACRSSRCSSYSTRNTGWRKP